MDSYYELPRTEIAALVTRPPKRVLEVGCGGGSFSAHFPEVSEYWGIEPVQAMAERASAKLHKVLVGMVEAHLDALPDAYFDLIVCNDVLEHMIDPQAVLRALQSKMAPGGELVGSVPNVRNSQLLKEVLVEKDWRYVDAGTLDRTHLRFFTLKSLGRVLRETGFVVDHVGGINTLWKWRGRRHALIPLAWAVIFGKDTLYNQLAFRLRLPS
ncbi:class I SAM-dependent methyltransferase [Aquariibacter albus]|uniref:Class I SAM-dependent methyltransferase n=1 Tax=Aquariibacter albus TaxID=2759899 RepID=A0A839HU90_9BURK|nr:class I SAM-dependent methyltransferase [Aquariibacter albus]MBB1163310.1 class I SAM-dependent methyltransferase [Aquariibacter albus]